jgi:predicted Holliday junction resolvase-like endonuclease
MMIAWIIAFLLLVCLLAALYLHRKTIEALRDQHDAAVFEAQAKSRFIQEAMDEVEEWKKRYLEEKAARGKIEQEAEDWRRKYWDCVQKDSDSYHTKTRKDEESWGDREPY